MRDSQTVTIVVSGGIAQSGTGGQAWAYMQYLAGLRDLGHDVVYLEDSGDYSHIWDWDAQEYTDALDHPARFIESCLAPIGMADRWIYRAGDGAAGMSVEEFRDVCARADLLLVRAIPLFVWRPEYDLPGRRAFVDVDPGFTQLTLSGSDRGFIEGVSRCERHFTIAARYGQPDCLIPSAGFQWRTTRPPVCLSLWPLGKPPEPPCFSSIIRWRGFQASSGTPYGQRDREFPKFIELPRRTSQRFLLAAMGVKSKELASYGWEVTFGPHVTRTPEAYEELIHESRAEFGVAKHCYVETRGGWFSDRSVCYLAAGRPVLLQDTGLGDWLPVGEGVVTFRDLDEAVSGVELINAGYPSHRAAARRIAEEFFDSREVLARLLEECMD